MRSPITPIVESFSFLEGDDKIKQEVFYEHRKEMKMKKILIVDGMALLFRGFYATSFKGNFMINADNIPTNGVFGLLKYLKNAIETFNPTHVICCWDMGSKTFRNELYPAYKSNRGAPPEELIPQFQLSKQVMEILDIPNVGVEGYEADDCIGTLANQYHIEDEVIILTGDQDMLQLVKENITVAIMKKGQGNYAVYQYDNFMEMAELTPEQIVELKGLMGDSSDNYPGVKGIGEKTARKLLQEYGTIDNMLENMEKLPAGLYKKISQDLNMLHLSRKLAKINCVSPVTCDLTKAEWILDKDKVEVMFNNHKLEKLGRIWR